MSLSAWSAAAFGESRRATIVDFPAASRPKKRIRSCRSFSLCFLRMVYRPILKCCSAQLCDGRRTGKSLMHEVHKITAQGGSGDLTQKLQLTRPSSNKLSVFQELTAKYKKPRPENAVATKRL